MSYKKFFIMGQIKKANIKMEKNMKSDDIIFNFFKQICDEKNDVKCVEIANNWIKSMEKNLSQMESNLNEMDKIKYKNDIEKNRQHLDSLKNKTSAEWRDYAKLCMVEIIDNKN